MEYYLFIGQQQSGPHSEVDVLAMVGSGKISRTCLARREGISDWQPLEALLSLPSQPAVPRGLPPLPPMSTPGVAPLHTQAVSMQRSTVLGTVSGIIAVILAIFSVFNIGGCIDAKNKLERFQRGQDDNATAEMVVETFRGISGDDPLRGLSGLFEKKRALDENLESFHLGALLCVAGTALAATVFFVSRRRQRQSR